MNRFRFGTGQYVTTNDNVNEVVAAMRARGHHNTANYIRNVQPAARRKKIAGAHARSMAYTGHVHSLSRNIAGAGNINAYFKRIGMTNMNKIKTMIALHNFPNNGPYSTNASRRYVIGNFEPTYRNRNWFYHPTNKTNWIRRAIAMATITRGVKQHKRSRNARRSMTASHVLRSIRVPSSARRSTSPHVLNQLPNLAIREIMRHAFPGQRMARNPTSPRRTR
jgi:hypothetical protein